MIVGTAVPTIIVGTTVSTIIVETTASTIIQQLLKQTFVLWLFLVPTTFVGTAVPTIIVGQLCQERLQEPKILFGGCSNNNFGRFVSPFLDYAFLKKIYILIKEGKHI